MGSEMCIRDRGKEIIWSRGAKVTGRPYLARAAEEHSGPHMPWFWEGSLQGGGVMLREEVTDADVATVVSRWTGVPVAKLVASEKQKLLQLTVIFQHL